MRKLMLLAAAMLSNVPMPASASSQMNITDASAVRYLIQDNKVYLRNLDQFDSTWLPCCYAYYMDLSTDKGKALFSVFLTAYNSRAPLFIYMPTPANGGELYALGRI